MKAAVLRPVQCGQTTKVLIIFFVFHGILKIIENKMFFSLWFKYVLLGMDGERGCCRAIVVSAKHPIGIKSFQNPFPAP